MVEVLFYGGLATIVLWFATTTFPVLVDVAEIIGLSLAGLYILQQLAFTLRKKLAGRVRVGKNKAVLVTGCDSGFGLAFAKRLEKEGFFVFAGCLSLETSGALQLKQICSDRLRILKLDVTKEEDVNATVNSVTEQLGERELWALVNNAGIATIGELEWMNMENIKELFEVNTFGAMRVSLAFLPLLRRSKGRLVTVTSYTVWIIFPALAAYAMSKRALHAFCDYLRFEVNKWGMKVSTLEPWLFRTSMGNKNFCLSSLDENWAKTREDIKVLYGAEYFDEYRKMTREFLETACDDFTLVEESLLDALLAKHPHYSYKPAHFPMNIPLWFQRLIPLWAENLIVGLYMPKNKPDLYKNK